jgi:lipopolysaccharide biosynthesis glycosyltransferase
VSHLTVFLGYDSRESAAWYVAAHSIMTRASRPVRIVPLMQSQLRSSGLYTRERRPNEATEFSLTRFLCPYLCDYQGFSLFLDCDVVAHADVYELLLFPLIDPGRAVYCCKHDYTPKALVKMDHHEQTKYQKKNWSSVMLLDNARCTALTPDYVNTATGLELHRFQWTTEDQVGSLPLAWNYLIGEDNQSPDDPKMLHYTNGMPWLDEYGHCDHAADWWAEYHAMLGPAKAMQVING